jgi:hypothetical protein
VREAEQSLRHQTVGTALKRIIEVITMQNQNDEWTKKYDALVQGKIERLQAMPATTRDALRHQWSDLFKEVERSLSLDPASVEAQALGERWLKLLEPFAAGPIDPALATNFGAARDTAQAWPRTGEALGDPRVWEFMQKVLALRAR